MVAADQIGERSPHSKKRLVSNWTGALTKKCVDTSQFGVLACLGELNAPARRARVATASLYPPGFDFRRY